MNATFPVPSGPFAGMSRDQVLAARATAQAALLQLATGGKPVSVSYAQGDGSKSVTFAPADEGRLRQLIAHLNGLLGQGARRAIGVRFR